MYAHTILLCTLIFSLYYVVVLFYVYFRYKFKLKPNIEMHTQTNLFTSLQAYFSFVRKKMMSYGNF